ALSPVLLGEHVGTRRWIAVSVGFAGAMILIRPGFAALQWGSILALCAGLSHALFNLFTRKLSGAAPPLVTLTYTAILGAAGMSLVVPFQWVTPAGADILLIETVFDTLNCKAAIYAVERFFDDRGARLPVMISGTITDASGRTLSGQTTEAFYNSIRHIKPISIGLNCALGPDLLRQYVEELSRVCETYTSVHPNAGLPNEFGEYDLEAPEMAKEIIDWGKSGFINIVGGCCGTTPAHIRAFAKGLEGVKPRPLPELEVRMRLSGLEACNLN
ncbi:hypothetical protein LCGC14_2755730, partial [marine sediment metagenome]